MVDRCRYAEYHTTNGHKCGKCGDFGHGRRECGNDEVILNLKNVELSSDDECKALGCRFRKYHIKEGHYCIKCKGYGHSRLECPDDVKYNNVKCPICNTSNNVPKVRKKAFVDATCCICLDNKASVFFPNCGHICICDMCYNKLLITA